MLLYTDGIVEATGPDGQEYGPQRVKELLLNSEGEPMQFIDRLFKQIATSTQQDDLTVVLTDFE